MTDRLTLSIRRTVALVRGEQTVEDAAYTALMRLAGVARQQLASSGMDPSVLDARNAVWQKVIDTDLLPVIGKVYAASYTDGLHPSIRPAVTAAASPAEPFPDPTLSLSNEAADLYLQHDVRNRLVGVSDTVYGQITAALREGRDARVETLLKDGSVAVSHGESIPQLAARVDALLSDSQHWRNRATVIARTETGFAHSAGYQAAAAYSAEQMGYKPADVAKEWLATNDSRTRPSHAEASGQKVIGLDSKFSVGSSLMLHPHDPAAPAGEVIQCRCTTLYHYPGDPDYPSDAGTAPHAADVDPETGLAPEAAYVDRILTDLKAGKFSPAQLREHLADKAPLSRANANAAIRAYEQHLQELAAAEPLKFANVTEARAWADQHWGDATAFSGRELTAMRSYTGSGYGPMNNLLRSSKGKRLNDDIRAIDSAIAKSNPIPQDVYVFRGTSLRQLGITADRIDPRTLIGQEFRDEGFLSTSLNGRTAFKGDVKLNIKVPAGSRGVWLSGGKGRNVISEVGPQENELLLARGSRLRVLGVRKVGDRWHVDAELIQEH